MYNVHTKIAQLKHTNRPAKWIKYEIGDAYRIETRWHMTYVSFCKCLYSKNLNVCFVTHVLVLFEHAAQRTEWKRRKKNEFQVDNCDFNFEWKNSSEFWWNSQMGNLSISWLKHTHHPMQWHHDAILLTNLHIFVLLLYSITLNDYKSPLFKFGHLVDGQM